MHVVVGMRMFVRVFVLMLVFMIVVVLVLSIAMVMIVLMVMRMFMIVIVIVRMIMVVLMIMRMRVIMFLMRLRHGRHSFVRMRVLVRMTKFRRFDDELRRAKTLLIHFVYMQPATGEAERIKAGLNLGEGRTGVDQSTERHVAADAAGTIEIANFHKSWRKRRENYGPTNAGR